MGIDTNYKKFLQRYLRCWKKVEGKSVLGGDPRGTEYVLPTIPAPSGNTIPFPRDVQVCIYDSTGKLKEFNGFKIKTGYDFVYKHVLDYPLNFLNVEGTEAFFQCFDRGSPINKNAEHLKRYSGLNPVDLDVFTDDCAVLSDATIVPADQWSRYTNDSVFKQEILHYITDKIVNPEERFNNWKPPPDKIYFLFGGTMDKAPSKRKERRGMARFVPSSDIFYVANQNGAAASPGKAVEPGNEEGMVGDYLERVEYKRMHGIYTAPDGSFPKRELENLLEGEMCAMYFSKVYSACGKNVMIISSDGDMLIQCLMACKDRIDAIVGGFRNKVYLRLLGRGFAEDVDINALYEDLCNDVVFSRCAIGDPAPLLAASSFLSQNDYFQDYCVGIGNCNADENPFGIPIPYVLWTMLRMMGTTLGSKMIRVIAENHHRDTNYTKIPVYVDEESFIIFTKLIYVYKYHKKACAKASSSKRGLSPQISASLGPKSSSSLGDSAEASVELKAAIEAIPHVRAYLQELSSVKNRLMVARKARIFSRCLEWVLNYFYNGYREDCRITSPVATLKNLSYHGWSLELDLEGNVECKMAERVSLRRHTEKFGWYFAKSSSKEDGGGERPHKGMQIYLPLPEEPTKEEDEEAKTLKAQEKEDARDEYKGREAGPDPSKRLKKKLKRQSETTKVRKTADGKPTKVLKPKKSLVNIERKHLV